MYEVTGNEEIVRNEYNFLSYPELDSLSMNYINMFFGNYSYPYTVKAELEKISAYCKKNDIKINFIILPNYREVHDHIRQRGLEDEQRKFYRDLMQLGRVYNFDLDVPEHHHRENFIDFFHPRLNLLNKCIAEIWK